MRSNLTNNVFAFYPIVQRWVLFLSVFVQMNSVSPVQTGLGLILPGFNPVFIPFLCQKRPWLYQPKKGLKMQGFGSAPGTFSARNWSTISSCESLKVFPGPVLKSWIKECFFKTDLMSASNSISCERLKNTSAKNTEKTLGWTLPKQILNQQTL